MSPATQKFADAVVAIIEDPTRCSRIPRRELAVIEGVLGAVTDWVHAELVERDKH